MVQLYVDAINAPDAIPNVQSAWDAFVEGKCADAKQCALQMYDALMTARLSDGLPCSNSDIRMCHNDALEECDDQLVTELAGISTNSVELTSREFQASRKKNFDEERSRELAARAYQEQERKRLEEQQARLQQGNLEQKKQMEMLIRNLNEEKRRFADQMNGERKAHQDQLQNMMEASMRKAQQERQAFMRENKAIQDRFLKFQERNQENMKMVKNLSDQAAQQEKEREVLRQQMKDQADQDKEDLMKAINDKHDEEMKALRNEMNVTSNEVERKVPPDEIKSGETAGLIEKRTREAEERQRKIAETREKQQEVEKPGFLKKALKFAGKVVPLVGVTVSAFVPGVAPIVLPVTAVVGGACEYVSDHFCSIM
ncbi:hypothetical protein AWC38_SpisGene18972 [Stylophora pistillata]|uniref:Guanylate-binding protein/Atlastin C-terminal domain-containing protein n=1 Tax=Stylophora pistillata TaxID=50429 RepID=A0A2B4RKG0_STYPI|nr:hypothetical protein AWC38_SpisGene18972 [Stylophora pistillata]